VSAVLRVDLDALARNLAVIRTRVAPARHMLVVKDDAYAHGLLPVVERAWAEGVRWFGAFDVPTGRAVRDALGPDARIFVWLLRGPDDVFDAVAADLDLGIGDRRLLDDAARAPGVARVHLKVDTGLHRNGIRPEEWDEAVSAAAGYERAGMLRVEGLWSHLAEASDAEDDAARARFLTAARSAGSAGLRPAVRHLAASAAAFARAEFREDLVRIGAFAYGIRPAGGPAEADLGLEQIGALTASVSAVRGANAHAALGSLDGLPSSLAGVVSVGTPAGPRRLLAVEPDEIVVEGWPDMRPGQTVAVLGRGAPHAFTDAAERIGTIGEEIALRVSPLVDRDYAGRVRPTR
jgi:alanine racemase